MDQHHGVVVHDSGDVRVIDCIQCGFKHILPLPDPDVQRKFYEEAFYQTEKTDYFAHSKEDFEWKATEFQLRLDVAASLMDIKTGKVLDIGCGPGDFLSVAKTMGWLEKGLEPSPVASRYAQERGLDVDCGFFDSVTAPLLGHYDFVHMSEVLEHIADPISALDLAKYCLRPGGVLCISVPNDFNPLQAAVAAEYDKVPWWIVPDHHINYFDHQSLSSLLESKGFSVEEQLTNFPMELFLLMGQDYTNDSALGRACHAQRKLLDLTLNKQDPTLLRRFYKSLAAAGLGRLSIIFATLK